MRIRYFAFLFIFSYPIFSININQLKEGDILFQKSSSRQAKALYYATKSKYTHVGIAFKRQNRWFIFEAIGTVKITRLSDFLNREKSQSAVVKRLNKRHNYLLTPAKIRNAKQILRKNYLGLPYDPYFEWTDKRIYCSELIWKIYRDVLDIKLTKLERLEDFDLSHPFVKKIIEERYGKTVPLKEKVISVVGLMNSSKLIMVGKLSK